MRDKPIGVAARSLGVHRLKRELFSALSAAVGRQIKRHGLVEEEVVADFESWRKGRRETRRGR